MYIGLLMSSEDPISSNNVLLKAEKEPWRFLGTRNPVIHKIEYATIYWSCIFNRINCTVSWGCRIHWLHLCRGVRPPPNECPGYDTKQSDGEVPAVLELWGMRSIPPLPSLPGPLWPRVVAPDRALFMG